MTRTLTVVLLSMLSAGVLTFCAPHPALAAPDNPAQCGRDLHTACLLETA